MGGDGEAAIQNMIAMGFERSEIERAMRAAFFNPDRAVDYLLNVSIVFPKYSLYLSYLRLTEYITGHS